LLPCVSWISVLRGCVYIHSTSTCGGHRHRTRRQTPNQRVGTSHSNGLRWIMDVTKRQDIVYCSILFPYKSISK
jgi:hypothetical protein